MSNPSQEATKEFLQLLEEIPGITKQMHSNTLLDNVTANRSHVEKSVKVLPRPTGEKARSGIVVSAGPSVHRRKSIHRIRDSGYKGTIIAADGSYVACLKAGLIPDYVLSLDTHPTRIVRWFGDPDFEKHSAGDDYFARQDLDVEFRANSVASNKANIDLVNKHAHQTKLIICSAASRTVEARTREAGFDRYWWNPLVDNPHEQDSLTRKLYNINKATCINTGGNVGTASYVFATSTLKLPKVAVVGMDLGYYGDTPFTETQYYYELLDRVRTLDGIEKYFVQYTYPGTGERYYTDAPYAWYRKSFFELFEKSPGTTYNCTEGGTLFGGRLKCLPLDDYFKLTS